LWVSDNKARATKLSFKPDGGKERIERGVEKGGVRKTKWQRVFSVGQGVGGGAQAKGVQLHEKEGDLNEGKSRGSSVAKGKKGGGKEGEKYYVKKTTSKWGLEKLYSKLLGGGRLREKRPCTQLVITDSRLGGKKNFWKCCDWWGKKEEEIRKTKGKLPEIEITLGLMGVIV